MAFADATTSVRAGPLGHPRSAPVLLGLAAGCIFGALIADAAEFALLARALPSASLDDGDAASATVGFLAMGLLLLVVAIGIEARWTRALDGLRPPAHGPAGEDTAALPEPSRGRLGRLRSLTLGSRLIALRSGWANAPDPMFDRVARAWSIGVALVPTFGFGAGVALLVGDPGATLVASGAGLVALWLLLLDILVGWSLARRVAAVVERRAAHAIVGWPDAEIRPEWRFARSGLIAVPLVVCLAAGNLAISTATAPTPIGSLGSVPCPQPESGCHAVKVPFDRTRPDDKRTIRVVYRMAPSTGGGQRLLIVAVGGPGDSGLAEMTDGRLDEIDDAIRTDYNIVFFDQRGVGASDGLHCPSAARDREPFDAVADEARDAQTFAKACVDETGRTPADLGAYSTAEAAEDLEAIRAQVGVQRFALYGESYGTRLAQAYAAAHPDRLDALILDGAIDPASDGPAFWAESAAGFDASLTATMDACRSDRECHRDLGSSDGVSVARDILFRIGQRETLPIPEPDGLRIEVVTRNEVAGAMEQALYTERGRVFLQRALTAVAQGDKSLLGRLVLLERESSPESRTAPWTASRESESSASYFAIECADYDYAPGQAGVDAFAAARRKTDAARALLATTVTQDLPCAYWPVHGQPPAPPATPGVATLVLASTADPVTPQGNAERIVARLPNASLVVSTGGPHVTWRASSTCVVTAVEGLLLQGVLPPRKTCPDDVADRYIPLPPLVSHDLPALDALESVWNETYAFPELDAWDGTGQFTIGCTHGGTIVLTTSPQPDTPITYAYHACGIFATLEVDGTGTYDPTTGSFRLDADVGTDHVVFTEDGRGHRVVDGTWSGTPIHTHD